MLLSLLNVSKLCKSFGGIVALSCVSFELFKGELLAVIGPNGAGKSTLFNTLNGQLKADSGSIKMGSLELSALSTNSIWRCGVSRTFQSAEVFLSLTALENLQIVFVSKDRKVFSPWRKLGSHKKMQALSLLVRVGMGEHANVPCSELSYGDLKRVELAMAIANEPQILLMDEPTAGMARAERNELMALVRKIVLDREMAVLFTEHSMDVVADHANRILFLAGGRLIADGAPMEVLGNAQVQEIYSGTENSFKKVGISELGRDGC